MELEKGPIKSVSSSPSRNGLPEYGQQEKHSGYGWTHFVDGFRRDPSAHQTPKGTMGANGKVFDMEVAVANTSNSPLDRKLKGRHLQMIAIGGSIGTGLFVGSGTVLASGGPASVVIAYCLIGVLLYCTVHALGEMAVLFPVAGSFSAYSTRFLDPAWGFAMGWNYALQWLVVLPLEIVSASFAIQFWNHGKYPVTGFIALFLVVIIAINLFGVRGYGEAEFIFASVKVLAIIGFILLGIIIDCGGGPYEDGPYAGYIGARFWSNPGAFHNGFKGLCSVFVSAAFAFGGTELVGLAAAETENPRKSLPSAVKQVFWRIALFYVISLTLVGLLVPYTEPRLLQATSDADATASPFVIAIQNAGIAGLPSVMNVVIMISVLSVGNSSVYGSSRTMAALAEQGQAPRILAYIDRRGRPIVAIGVASALGFLAFIGASKKSPDAFHWMLALSGLSSLFTWGSICLAHIRFRKGWKAQGHSLDELAFRSQPGVIGSWLGFVLIILVLIAQFWTGLWPISAKPLTASQRAESLFGGGYLAAAVVLVCYLPYKVFYRTPFVRTHNMDLVSGRRELNITHLIAEEKAEQASWPTWKRVYKMFC
ncbi:amino acid permease [Myriangium duriaei CBS 260.36]|uniref:Amino acid permease n=1 Tax=Myriangium duriaei CBS 260.36 TaxID=1168546 RepID=A0A9P4JEZ7_9PEZI|nr:amino acid permease [Myriangium duriaei CBS 260.36]